VAALALAAFALGVSERVAAAHETFWSTGMPICSRMPYRGFHSHAHGNAISDPGPGFETYGLTVAPGEKLSVTVTAKSVNNAVNGATMYFRIWDASGTQVAAKSGMGLSESSWTTHSWTWTNNTALPLEGTFGLGLRYGNAWFAMDANVSGPMSEQCSRFLAGNLRALFGFRDASAYYADPVNVALGNFVSEQTDLEFGLRSAIAWSRTYNSRNIDQGALGKGWSHNYSEHLVGYPDGSVELFDRDGRQVVFTPDPAGGWFRPEELRGELVDLGDGRHRIDWFDGSASEFDATGGVERLLQADGEIITVERDISGAHLESVTSSRGPSLSFAYTGDQITQVLSDDGRTVSYGYDLLSGYAGVFLNSVTDQFGDTETYQPDDFDRIWKEINPAGVIVVNNTYDALGRVKSQIAQAGTTSTFTYDVDPQAPMVSTSVLDSESGASLVYTHDDAGRLRSVEDPFGQTIERSSHDEHGNPESRLDRHGNTFQSDFNDQDQPVSITDPRTGTTTFNYDTLHRLASVTVPNGTPSGATTTFGYQGTERLPTTVTDDLGHVTTYDVVDGLVMTVTDADDVATAFTYWPNRLLKTATQTVAGVDLVTSYAYDSQGRLRFVTSPEGHVTETHYDSDGRVDFEIAADGGRTDYQYDAGGRLWRITGPELSLTDSRRPLTTLEYSPVSGLLWKERRPGPGATGLPEAVTEYVYDSAGNVEAVIYPDGTTTSATHTGLGRVSTSDDQVGRTTTFGYGPDGEVQTISNQAAEFTETVYDTVGRAEFQYDEERRETRTTYDNAGRVATVARTGADGNATADDAITSYGYDALNRANMTTDARGGQTVTTYTAAGRVDTVTTPDGVVTDHGYDTAGRLTSIVRSGTPARVTSYGYDRDGRVLSVTSPTGEVTSSTYDPAGRVLTSTDAAGVVRTRTWSKHGQLLTDQLEGHGVVSYVYDLAGNLASVTDALGNPTMFTYDALGRKRTRENALGKVEQWTYHDDGQLESYTDALVDGQGARTTGYTYDPNTGRLTTVTDPSGRTTSLGYNAAGQLVQRTAAMLGGSGTVTDDLTQVFDPHSGRLVSSTNAVGTTTHTYNLAGDILDTTTPDGRRTSYRYDTAGRRTNLTHPDGTSLDYAYDPVTGRLDTITPTWSLADTFTLADGRSASIAKWSTSGTGAAVVNGNRLELEPGAPSLSLTPQVPATADSDVTFSYDLPEGTTDVMIQRVLLRASGERGYRVDVASDGTTVELYRDHETGDTLIGTAARPSGGGAERMRIRVEDATVRVKVWAAGSPEPAAWGIDTTVSGVTAAAALQIQVLQTAGVPASWIDDVTYLDLDVPPAAVVSYDWDLDDRLVAESLLDHTRSWDYVDGQLTAYGYRHVDSGTTGQQTFDFNPTGITRRTFSFADATEQSWQVPSGVTSITVDMTGGEGGASRMPGTTGGLGGLGGRVQATLAVTPGETLRLGVGGAGTDSDLQAGGTGRFYAGASGGSGALAGGGGGGGQSYIKQGGTTDSHRVLIAGGGGGGQNNNNARAGAGGWAADNQTTVPRTSTSGTNGGALTNGGGGGGGGWRGGLGGPAGGGAAQGGTNMSDITVATDVASTPGFQPGNGYVTITWVLPNPAEQSWQVPEGVTSITVDMAGGEGGVSRLPGGTGGLGGLGGRVQATLDVIPGETLLLGVAGAGTDSSLQAGGTGRFYAGANGGSGAVTGGGGGGGQSYIKQGGTTDTHRVLVAGGGGGGQNNRATRAGSGGWALDSATTLPRTSTAGGNGTALTNGGGGGGGGWRGGLGGPAGGGVAEGGTNMADPATATVVSTTAGFRLGDGYITISWEFTDPADLATTLTYDDAGMVETETTNGVTTSYTYDDAGQLLTAATPSNTRTWTYDELGRWSTATRPDGSFAYSYDDANQLTLADCIAGACNDTVFTYDRAGRRLTAASTTGSTTHVYNPRGRLQTTTAIQGPATTVTARAYDAADNLDTVSVDDGTDTTTATYTWDNTKAVADVIEYDHGGTPVAFINDGGPVATTSSGGSIGLTSLPTTWQQDDPGLGTDPYGRPEEPPSPLGQLGYRGELHVGDLIHLRNRDYDPATGQFLTTDPLPGVEGTTTVANPYHYANNNPIRFIDPLGLQATDFSLRECAARGIGNFPRDMWRSLDTLATNPTQIGRSYRAEVRRLEGLSRNAGLGVLSRPAGEVLGAFSSFFPGVRSASDAGVAAIKGDWQRACESALRAGAEAAAVKAGTRLAEELRSWRATNTVDDIAGLADDYVDITAKGSRVRNVQTTVSRSSFERNLIEAGYKPTVVSSGRNVVSYELNGTRYVVRDAATSTGGPTADFYPPGSSSVTLKIRLSG